MVDSAPAGAIGEAMSAPAPIDRERAILEFNRRVLAQARRADVPLLERLRYVTIVSSNLDEFFEVRFVDAMESARAVSSEGAGARLRALREAARALVDEQYALLNEDVMPALGQAGIVLLNHAERTPAQRRWVARYFEDEVRPMMMPVALDPSHPFPVVANKSLNFIARLGGRDAFGRENSIAIVKVPRVLRRVIRLPADLCEGRQGFVLLTSVIRAHMADLFPGRTVEAFSQFRVTRDSELEVDEHDVTNLRQALRSGLTTRHFGQAIRLEVVRSCPLELSRLLLQHCGLDEEALFRVNGPVNLVRLNELIDQADAPKLRFSPFEPKWPAARLVPGRSIFAQLRQGDVVLHHPFESFDPVVQFLREAVEDPDVLAIKQTIYRTGTQSVLMDLLLEAARRGKEVLAVLELKARFDEEANINWADRLESVGAQVVYGVVGLKTHAKMLLVIRREASGAGENGPRDAMRLCRYLHLSTGNYNPKTARLYTDIGYLTADPAMTADADALFLQITSQARVPPPRHLVTAPFRMHRRMVRLLRRVGAAAEGGRAARIVLKLNALTEPKLIMEILAAGRAGAQVDLVVRGACELQPGVPGQSENVRVRSLVGRFLEHTRVLYFRWGPGGDDEALYLSSADWMPRNMFGRIEVAWPVRDPVLRQRVVDEALVPYLHDETDAWLMQTDGSYRRVAEAGASAQRALMRRYAD